MFSAGALIHLSTILEFAGPYYWQPYNLKNLFIPFLQAFAPQVAAFSLLSFVYHFPHFQKPDRREYRVIRALYMLVHLGILGLTYYNFIYLKRQRGIIGFEKTYYIVFYITLAVQFTLAVLLLLRKAVRFSSGKARPWWLKLLKPQDKNARAAASLALVLALPTVVVVVYVLENRGILPRYLSTYLIWLIFLLFYSSFVVTYLTHTVERTTFQVKLVGVVLVFVLGVLGLISLVAGKAYEKDYQTEDLVSGHRTIHFAPNRFDSYTISAVPYRFDADLGSPLELGYDQSTALKLAFPFRFFAKTHRTVQVLHGPMILLGENIGGKSWGGYNPEPAIAPLLMNFDLTQGGGIYSKNQPDRLTVTWHELSEYGHSNSNTIQLVLHGDGSFDFSYREIKIESGYSPIQMYVYTSATVTGHHPGAAGGPAPIGPRLIGIHPGTRVAEPRPIRFSGGLPYISAAPEILVEAYDIDFYRHLHSRMSALVVVLIVSSLFILFVLPLLLKTSLIRPLQALYRGMERADSGDLEVYIAPQFNDEIGALTLFFNGMLQSIQKAEANFRALAENARDGILIVSGEGKIYYGNRSAEQITKLSHRELLAAPLQEIIRFRGRETLGKQLWEELDEQQASKHLEAAVVSHGDVDISVELTVSETNWHRMPAYVVVLRDITERKRDEEQDRLYQQRLIQTDKLTTLGILAGAVAHDISNPNQVILAVSRILNRAWTEVHPTYTRGITEKEHFLIAGFDQKELLGNIAGWLADIEVNSVRINSIVQSLKSYLQGEPTTKSSVNLSGIVRSAVELIGYHIRRATDRFILDLQETIPHIRANPQQLEQVIINLILNSCQALPERDRSIKVSTSNEGKPGLVTLTVRDQGGGIPEEDLVRIKEPFFTTKREKGGIGLGLYIAASIVDEHRGSLTFKSTPGKGTEVEAAFPEESAK